ncbi:putative membrane protein [Synechococcus sp. A15-127]|nr:putative membrane protein [Synechococcus sp. A15-127]
MNNFALRLELVKETMFRNDFRFFSVSHKDLYILNWLTPYVSIWMLVNAAELFTICILSTKTAGELSNRSNRNEILLIFSILFLIDTATGFTFFQFIYSERVVALLFAVYIYFYTRYLNSNDPEINT